MAYFANGSEGECFEDQCDECKYGKRPCPISLVQMSYNYDAVGNDIATKILNELVRDNGTCQMFALSPKNFQANEYDKLAMDLFK